LRTRVLETSAEVASAAADLLAGEVAALPDMALALPTGRTPLPFYDELARRHQAAAIDLRRARAFNIDEVVLPREDPRTCRAFMARHVWERTGLRRELCGIPDAGAADLEAECRRYEDAIATAGGLDLAILGVGTDGHVAYNLPGPITLPTHVVRLPDGLAASLGVPAEAWPLRAITMGLGTIRSARAILVIATGASKATAVRALARGPADPEWPCTFLTSHPDILVLADHAAAAAL